MDEMAAALKAVAVVRVRDGRRAADVDRAAAEEPLEVRLHGRPFAVIMRTPGADRELAAGFLFAERVLTSADDLGTIEHCADGDDRAPRQNVINVTLANRTAAELERVLAGRRATATNSSCGLCGRLTIESLKVEAAPLPADWRVDGRRKFSRDAARRRPMPARARQAAPPHPPRHRPLLVDAGRQRRRRPDSSGGHQIRGAGRRHRNVHRAENHLLAGDSGPTHRIGPLRMVGVRGSDGARRSEPCELHPLRQRRGHSRRDRQGRAALRGHRNPGGQRRSGAVGRADALWRRAFATPDGKAHFSPVSAGRGARAPGADRAEQSDFVVSTRRGKQFNSMIQRAVDPLTGAGRDDVLISEDDLRRLHLRNGDAVRLRSVNGAFDGRLKAAPIRSGNLEVHWPEGNVLLSGLAIDPDSKEPDFNAVVVSLDPITRFHE